MLLHCARVRPKAHAMAKETVLTNAQYVLFLLLRILSVLSIFIDVIKGMKIHECNCISPKLEAKSSIDF